MKKKTDEYLCQLVSLFLLFCDLMFNINPSGKTAPASHCGSINVGDQKLILTVFRVSVRKRLSIKILEIDGMKFQMLYSLLC